MFLSIFSHTDVSETALTTPHTKTENMFEDATARQRSTITIWSVEHQKHRNPLTIGERNHSSVLALPTPPRPHQLILEGIKLLGLY